jgi:hypothetical protein
VASFRFERNTNVEFLKKPRQLILQKVLDTTTSNTLAFLALLNNIKSLALFNYGALRTVVSTVTSPAMVIVVKQRVQLDT